MWPCWHKPGRGPTLPKNRTNRRAYCFPSPSRMGLLAPLQPLGEQRHEQGSDQGGCQHATEHLRANRLACGHPGDAEEGQWDNPCTNASEVMTMGESASGRPPWLHRPPSCHRHISGPRIPRSESCFWRRAISTRPTRIEARRQKRKQGTYHRFSTKHLFRPFHRYGNSSFPALVGSTMQNDVAHFCLTSQAMPAQLHYPPK